MQCKDVTPIIAELVRLKNSIPLKIDVGRYLPEVRKNTHGEAVRSGLKKALRVIEQAPVVDAMHRWISVEERLPKHGAMVLCNTKNYIEVLQWHERDGLWVGMRTINPKGYVTHWMPLPQLPKEE